MMQSGTGLNPPVPPLFTTSVITSPGNGGIVHHLPPMPHNIPMHPPPHNLMQFQQEMHARAQFRGRYQPYHRPEPLAARNVNLSLLPHLLQPTRLPSSPTTPSRHARQSSTPTSTTIINNHTSDEIEIIQEKEIPKEEVETLLKERKAVVMLESGKRVRSEVWHYMGRVRLVECGSQCKEVVACIGCKATYAYKTKSQGTSTLRHHKCDYVYLVGSQIEIMKKDKADRDALDKAMVLAAKGGLQERDPVASQNTPVFKKPIRPRHREYQQVPWNLNINSQQGDGRHQQRELTPEGDDRKPVMPTPPPLKEHIMNSPSPQSVHPASLHQGTPVSGGMGGGGLVNNGGRSSSSVGGCASPPPPASKDSQPHQLLCVRWGNFDSNIVSMFSKLRTQEHFVDVTLWCEGKTIKCHKMILSACSLYFEKLLTEYPNPHPIIFLKDMRFWEIQALVDFMYRGEVSVQQEKLQFLLRAAESLQIKGLGSPTNEMGMPGVDGQNSMDEDTINSTDMSGNTSHNNISSHLQNHISSKDDNGTNSNSSSNNHSLHSSHNALGVPTNSGSNHQASWQKFSSHTATSNMMGIDLSNHSTSAATGSLSLSNIHGGNLSLPLSLSAGSPQSGSGSQGSGCGQAAKRRKKETPRRIDLPRTAGMPLPTFNSTMGSEMEEDDDAASEDSMAAHERNHVDISGLKVDLQHDQSYGDDEDCDAPENYDENDQGGHGEDEISSDHGDMDMDEEQDGALSLRVSNLSDNERERSRKGNPMKKILGIGNNNNNNEGGQQNLIHNVSSGGD